MSRHGWDIILTRYLPNFIKKNDFYNYKLIIKKSIFNILKNSSILILILLVIDYILKNFFDINIFNNLSNLIYACCLIFLISLHFIFKSIIQSHGKIKMSLLSEIGSVHLFSTFIIAAMFYLNIQINIDLIIITMITTSVILNLLNYLIVLYLENCFFDTQNTNNIIFKENKYQKILPSYFLNTLSNYIFEWGVFYAFFILKLNEGSALFFSAMQSKFFVVFFFVAFVRKYSHKFSVNIEEKNIIKLSMLIKSFNTNVFLLSIIVLMLFISFNNELISLMYKTSLKDINMMCLSFVFFEVIYLLFGCPQTIGMLSKYHYLFSRINFIVSILYFFSQLITIYLFGVWGGIFTFGFFYIIKNIISSYFIYKKIKIVTLNDFLIKIYRGLKYFI